MPIVHQPCEVDRLSWTLKAFQFVDFSTQSFDDACRDLLRIWSLGWQPSRGPGGAVPTAGKGTA